MRDLAEITRDLNAIGDELLAHQQQYSILDRSPAALALTEIRYRHCWLMHAMTALPPTTDDLIVDVAGHLARHRQRRELEAEHV